MLWRLLLAVAAGMAESAQGAGTAGPSWFYVVSWFFSDSGAQSYYRILEVSPEGAGSRVRYARVAPADAHCTRMVVQAAEAAAPGRTPADLAPRTNPCSVRRRDLDAALGKRRESSGGFESITYGIVARCGGSSVTLGLPDVSSRDWERVKSVRPAAARLWLLADEIAAAVFGGKDIFHDIGEEQDLALQRAGQKLLPALTSGEFDAGLAAALKGRSSWRKPSFRAILANYRGPFTAAQAKTAYVPRLLNPEAYRFLRYAAPAYGRLALLARVEGRVELELTVQPGTGEVLGAAVVPGHPLLKPAAVEAARQWRFEPDSLASGTVNVTLEFAIRCQ